MVNVLFFNKNLPLKYDNSALWLSWRLIPPIIVDLFL